MIKQEQTEKWLNLIYPEYENKNDLLNIIRYNTWYIVLQDDKLTTQEQAKRWLSLIYPENENVNINPVYLKRYTKPEILESFSHFRSYIISIFTEISEGNIQFPSGLRCIFAVISAIANSGRLNGDIFSVDIKAFKDRLKKPIKAAKEAVINLLKNNGFIFENDIFSRTENTCFVEFPDDPLVLKGMYLFSITHDNGINQGMNTNHQMHVLLNPRLFEYTSKDNTWPRSTPFIFDDLFRFFDGKEEKEAIGYFHEKMLEYGYKFNLCISIFDKGGQFPGVFLRYDYKTSQDYTQGDARAIVRVNLENRVPSIGIKIQDMRKYNDYIKNCSDEFKYSLDILWDDCYCSTDKCRQKEHKEPCKHRLEYILNDTQYRKCTYEIWQYKWNQTVFKVTKNDIDTYLYFIRENDIKKKAVK